MRTPGFLVIPPIYHPLQTPQIKRTEATMPLAVNVRGSKADLHRRISSKPYPCERMEPHCQAQQLQRATLEPPNRAAKAAAAPYKPGSAWAISFTGNCSRIDL